MYIYITKRYSEGVSNTAALVGVMVKLTYFFILTAVINLSVAFIFSFYSF